MVSVEGVLEMGLRERLLEMENKSKPDIKPWREAIYGSMRSWLVFVGPSPGGSGKKTVKDDVNRPPGEEIKDQTWNEPLTRPFKWGSHCRSTMPILIETITGLTARDGAYKIYGVANFDYIGNSKADTIKEERIIAGIPHVRDFLNLTKPKVMVAIHKRAYDKLIDFLGEEYTLLDVGKVTGAKPQFCVSDWKGGHHRHLFAVKLKGKGVLNNSLVIRS
ncbi:MAG: hypothetical protein KAV87_41005, partial [Desulfobacteraceae bacterium]|nr:hypothetical protein [Desulfobacteraceae bacterium]